MAHCTNIWLEACTPSLRLDLTLDMLWVWEIVVHLNLKKAHLKIVRHDAIHAYHSIICIVLSKKATHTSWPKYYFHQCKLWTWFRNKEINYMDIPQTWGCSHQLEQLISTNWFSFNHWNGISSIESSHKGHCTPLMTINKTWNL